MPSSLRGDTSEVDAALSGLGVVTTSHDPAVRRQMAYEMFDTRGSVRHGGTGGQEGAPGFRALLAFSAAGDSIV